MKDFIEKYSDVWGDDPTSLMRDYNYLPEQTSELDNMDINLFDREKLYEIILWKLNRFPEISNELIDKLKKLSELNKGEHRQAKKTIEELLKSKGVALPMASTILRFMNPSVFQIIDDRVFRILFPEKKKYSPKPSKVTNGYLENTINLYYEYIEKLHALSSFKLPFEQADRIIYQLDIVLGNKIGDK